MPFLPTGLFPWSFPIKILFAFIVSPYMVHVLSISFFLI
jgi:hypothetical protein